MIAVPDSNDSLETMSLPASAEAGISAAADAGAASQAREAGDARFINTLRFLLPKPGQFLLCGPRSAYYAQENLLQGQLLPCGLRAIAGRGGCLRLDSGSQFF